MSIFSNFTRSIKEKGEQMGAEMSFFQHLEALRWHLIRAAAVILLITIFAFSFFDKIFDSIIMAPTRTDFWTYRMMCNMGDVFHSIFPFLDAKGFCVQEIKFDLINTELAG